MSLLYRIHEAHLKQPDAELVKKVTKAASAAAKMKLKVETSKKSAKGWDFTFKGGGKFKIRPKAETYTVKLQGVPKPHYRYRGDGPSLEHALAALKPEKAGTPPIKPKKPKGKALPWKTGEPGPTQANINGLRFHNDLGVDQETFDRYAMAAKDSVDLLKRRGFGFMVSKVSMHLRAGGPGIAGNYDMKTAEVEIFVNIIGAKTSPTKIMFTMVHELGHHYYYREISRAKRKSYRWFFGRAYGGKAPMTAKGGKRVPAKIAAKAHAAGAFPTQYGATVRYEDFAEIFAAYIGKGHALSTKYKLTPDIMQRFKSFMADDKRVDLREDDAGSEPAHPWHQLIAHRARCGLCEAKAGYVPPVPSCHDRVRHHNKVPQLDKAHSEAGRIATVAGALRSAIMCREKDEVDRFMGLLIGAIANLKREINSQPARAAFDWERKILNPKPQAAKAAKPAKTRALAREKAGVR